MTSLLATPVLVLSGILMIPRAAAATGATVEELQTLLAERDAAIIELQNTVRVMMDRLESVERALGSDVEAPPAGMARSPAPVAPATAAGGAAEPVEEFGRLAVDELAAQRALERTLTQRGALLLPAGTLEISPTFGYSFNTFEDAPVTAKIERSVLTADLDLRIGMPFDTQLELGLPYRWADEDVQPRVPVTTWDASSQDGSGAGGLRVGLAKTFFRERGWRPDMVGRFTWNTGSGDLTDGGVLIGDFESIEASLTFIKRQDPIVFVGSIGYENFSSEEGLKPGDQLSFSLGAAVAITPSTSFSSSIGNQFLDEARFRGEDLEGSGFTSVTLNLGASTVIARGVLLSLVTGIGVSDDAPDYSIGLSSTIRSNVLRNVLD
jgi:uncharacterized coiled-coil protein SlyX